MHSTKALVSRRLLALGYSNLVKTRGVKQFRLDDVHYKPGALQDRVYRRTWADRHEVESVEYPAEVNERFDETMYNPGRWTEREYQPTWREPEMEEEEPQAETEPERPRYQEREPRARAPAPAVPQRPFDPRRRLQRIAVPVGEFISQFISDQKKRKMRHYEAEVFADRLGYEGYQLS